MAICAQKPYNRTLIWKILQCLDRKIKNRLIRKIEIGIIEAEIRIEATQLTRKIVPALLPSTTL